MYGLICIGCMKLYELLLLGQDFCEREILHLKGNKDQKSSQQATLSDSYK